jgi:hypothetical protein
MRSILRLLEAAGLSALAEFEHRQPTANCIEQMPESR